MPKITEFNRPVLASIRADIDAALVSLNAKYADQGVMFSLGRGTFSPTTCNFQLATALKTEGSNARSPADVKAERDWKAYAHFDGLDTQWLGTTFTYAKREVTIIGYMPRRAKFPILVREVGGKDVLLPVEPVKAILARRDAAATPVAA